MLSEIITPFLKCQLSLGKKFEILLYSWDDSSEKVVAAGNLAKFNQRFFTVLHLCYIIAQILAILGSSTCVAPGDRATTILFTLTYMVPFPFVCEWNPDSSIIQLLNILTATTGTKPRKSLRTLHI